MTSAPTKIIQMLFISMGLIMTTQTGIAQQKMDRTLKLLAVPGGLSLNAAHYWVPDKELDHLAKTGVRYVRHATFWGDIETEKGKYDFSKHDAVYDALNKNGIGVIYILAYNNSLYEPKGSKGIRTAAGRKAFANFAAAMVQHFKGKNVVWEIWNEPNVRGFWGRDRKPNSRDIALEYSALVKETVPAMRKANPDCVILAGSVSCLWRDSYNWCKYVFEDGILDVDFDGWSVHPYNFKRPEDYPEAYEHVRELMRQHGKISKLPPLVNSERGYPIGKAEGYAGGKTKLQEQYQAAHYVRQYLMDLLCDVRMTVWYAWGKQKFGMITGKRERPAVAASVQLVKELTGYSLVKRLKTDSDLDYLLLFSNQAGSRKLVAWTAPPTKQTPDKAIPHTILIPAMGAKTIAVTDIYGKESGQAPVTDGSVELKITAFPQYLTIN